MYICIYIYILQYSILFAVLVSVGEAAALLGQPARAGQPRASASGRAASDACPKDQTRLTKRPYG